MATHTTKQTKASDPLPKQLWGTLAPAPTGGSGPYLTNRACEETLKASCHALGISGYRMAHLLGVRTENYSKWFNGSSRPSSKYFARVAMVHVFKSFGLMLDFVDRIDWVNDEVVYKKGVRLGDARGRDSIHKFCGGISEEKSQT